MLNPCILAGPTPSVLIGGVQLFLALRQSAACPHRMDSELEPADTLGDEEVSRRRCEDFDGAHDSGMSSFDGPFDAAFIFSSLCPEMVERMYAVPNCPPARAAAISSSGCMRRRSPTGPSIAGNPSWPKHAHSQVTVPEGHSASWP
jgi:hypothetical protein